MRHRSRDVEQRVLIIAAALGSQIVDIEPVAAKEGSDLGKHVGNIPVQDRDARHRLAYAGVNARIIHGVPDIAVIQIILQLADSHHCAVILGLLCGCSEVRQNDGVLHFDRERIGEIRHIRPDFSALEGFSHGLLIDKRVARKIEETHAVFHLCDGFSADHAFRRIVAGYVDRDIVALRVYIVQISGDVRSSGKAPGCVDRQVRVIAEDIHVEVHRGIGHLNADRAEADHAEFFIGQFISCKCFLRLLRSLPDILIVSVVFHPDSPSDNIPGSQKKTGDGEFLDGVGICTRGIKDNDAFLAAALKRNIVHSGSRPRDCPKFRRELHVLHVGRTHENAGGLINCVCQFITGPEIPKTHFTNVVQAKYLSIFHQILPSFQVSLRRLPRNHCHFLMAAACRTVSARLSR